MPLAKAQAEVSKLHMTLKEEAPVKSITIGAGAVVSQSPKPGTSLKEGSTVKVSLSDGPPDVAVPNLANMTCAQAAGGTPDGAPQRHLYAGGLQRHRGRDHDHLLVGREHAESDRGAVRQHHHDRALARSPPATVPNIPTTYTFAQAQAALQAVGLTATQANATSTTVAAGDVISTTPASGAAAPYGSAVTVTVSTGPPTTTVPNVNGDTVDQATTALQSAGLVAAGVSGNPQNNVVGTQPSIGSTVPTGSSVQLITHSPAHGAPDRPEL